ncbi:MAG: CHASE3 domain-containing protein, partial [Sphingomonadales bacterium]|nr:CHASE3 domain-containing protein [Sphingomonadales bacterium]
MVTTQSRRPVILLALGFAVLAIAVLVAYRATVLQERANDWVRHTLRVQAQISDVGRMVTLAETGQRGYLLTGDQSYLVPFNSARTDLPGLLRSLAAATSDNPPQVVAATQLRQLVSTRMEVLDMGVQLMMAGKKDEAADLLRSGRGHSVMLEFSDVLQRMLHEEERLLDYRSALATQRNMIARTMLALSFVFAVVLAVFAVRGMKLRIDELGATVERLNAESAARNQAQGQV